MFERLYAIYDLKSMSYDKPFSAPNHGSAIRAVRSAMRDPNSSLVLFPADFQIFCIGGFDHGTGVVTAVTPVELVAQVLALVDKGVDMQVGGLL